MECGDMSCTLHANLRWQPKSGPPPAEHWERRRPAGIPNSTHNRFAAGDVSAPSRQARGKRRRSAFATSALLRSRICRIPKRRCRLEDAC